MMNKKTLFLYWLFLWVSVMSTATAWGQKSSGSIVGTVINQSTREAIPYAQVIVVGTTLGTAADASGNYKISGLPAGTYTLEARMLGFGTGRERVSVGGDKNPRHLDFYLSEQSIEIDGVIVSANRQTTLRRKAPSLVTVLGSDVFVKTNSENLSQGLRFQPGLRVEDNCQNCGFNQVRINGLDGAYSQVLIDSRPMMSALAAVYGLEQIPSTMIDRVEVVRGGGSALFGANAVGGVINVITREPMSNSISATQTLTSYANESGRYTSLQPTTQFHGSLVSEDRRAAMMLFGQSSRRLGHDYNGDGFSELPQLNNKSLGLRTYYKPSIYSKLTAEYRTLHENRRGGDRLDRPVFEAAIAEALEHHIDGGSLKYELTLPSWKSNLTLYASAQEVLRKSYYGGGDAAEELLKKATSPDPGVRSEALTSLTAYGRSRGVDAQLGGLWVQTLAQGLDLTAGLEGTYGLLNDKSGFRPSNIDQVVTTYSHFDQLEYKSERWNVLLGGRLDYVLLSQGGHRAINPLLVFSPRMSLRYNPIKDLGLRLSYSEGFRTPQFFDEEMHVELAGGKPIARVLSRDLKEERSRSLSASADWYGSLGSGWEFNLMLEGFATFLRNQFVASPIETKIGGITQRTIINGDGTGRVWGINLEGKIAYRRLWELQAGITLQRSRYGVPKTLIDEDADTGQEEITTVDYERTPKLYGYFTSTFRPMRRLVLNLSGTFTGSMLAAHEAYSGYKDLFPSGTPLDKRGHFDVVADGQRMRGVAPGHGYLAQTKAMFDLDAKISYEIPLTSVIDLDLALGVQNIFDAYQRDADMGSGRASTYVYGPMLPRRVYASVSFHF